MSDPIVIVAAARTPMGGFQGSLASLTAPQLGAQAIAAALARSGLPAEAIDEVLMGCVLPAGLGQAPARPLQSSVPFRYALRCCQALAMETTQLGPENRKL